MCDDFLKPGERKLQQSPLPGLSTESKSEMATSHVQKPARLLMKLPPATSKKQGRGHGRGSKARAMPLFLTWPGKGSWAAVEHMGARVSWQWVLSAPSPCSQLCLLWPLAGSGWPLGAGAAQQPGCPACMREITAPSGAQARGWHRRQGWGGRSGRPTSVYRGRKLQKQLKSGEKARGRRDSAGKMGLGEGRENKTRTISQGNEIKRREKQEGRVSKL